MEKLINLLPTEEGRQVALASWEACKTPEDILLLLQAITKDLWEVNTQPGNNYGPDHPWHYPSAVGNTAIKVLKTLLSNTNYALTINIPDSYQIEHEELIEDWTGEYGHDTLKRFITFLVNFAFDWTFEAVMLDNGEDDGGPFMNLYFIKRGYNVYDLMHLADANPDETIWFPKGLLGIPWMYANKPELISSITQHVL